ncbi:MAG TPA: hypothetical protein VKB87_06255 [Myxococcaceae bacterium]|nr:hypothetical protein [Myxococcaceae bacterium]
MQAQDGSARRNQVVLAAAIAFAFAIATGSGIEGLGDTDPYRHLEYAQQLWKSGFALRNHPFLPFTLLADPGADLWWGFHLLLLPLTPLGNVWGSRIAGALIAAALAGTMAYLIHRGGQRRAAVFALLPLVASPVFAYRDHLARPAHLTSALIALSVFAGASLLSPIVGGVASFIHSLVHMSSPLSPIFALLGALGSWLGWRLFEQRDAAPPRAGKAILWSIGGLAAGLLLRPDRAAYPFVAYKISTAALGATSMGRLPHVAFELQPISAQLLMRNVVGALAALAVAIVIGWKKERAGKPRLLGAVLVASAASLILCFRSSRFLDYLVPQLALAAAMFWSRGGILVAMPRLRAALAGATALVVAWFGWSNIVQAWQVGNRYLDPPAVFEQLATAVRAHVPPGSLLFTDDPFMTSVLYASLPEYRYIVAYDPAVLFTASPRLFWRWHHAVADGIACDERECPGEKPSPAAIAWAIQSFGSSWAVTSSPVRAFSMQSVMAQGQPFFELAAFSPRRTSGGLYLWHVKAPPQPSARIEH